MLDAPTLWGLAEVRASTTPDAEMVVDETGRRLTFAEYRDRVRAGGGGALRSSGCGAGDTVTWQLPTWIESLVLVGALARLGAVQNPILPSTASARSASCVRQTGARLLVVPGDMAAASTTGRWPTSIAADAASVRRAALRPPLPEADPAELPPPAAPIDGDEVRWCFYTSGTTADPKGAQHTDRTIMPWPGAWASGSSVTDGRPQRPGLPVHRTSAASAGW